MWIKASKIILRKKYFLLVVLAIITVFFGFYALRVEMSYEYSSLLSKKDQTYKDYRHFIDVFGEEGNLIVIGTHDPDFFRLDHFKRWQRYCDELSAIDGVGSLISVANSYNLEKNTDDRRFEIKKIFPETVNTQEELDGFVEELNSIPLYKRLLYNDQTDAYLLAITVNKEKMESDEREQLIRAIQRVSYQFEKDEQVDMHYSGLPYIRVVSAMKIKNELYMFSLLAMSICILVLFLLFRSFKVVFVPVLIVSISVIWALGMLSLFGYKITLLSGMIPPLLIVIGIPNSVYMLNKFHHEFSTHGNKIKALQRVIIKIGNATFLTNLTTAAGFATFIIVKSDILKQFGIITSLNILGLFVLSVLLIPIIFSIVGPPSTKSVRHLENKYITKTIERVVRITQYHRKKVYVTTIVIVSLAVYGITLIKTSGYMVDDIPERDPIYLDLKFFENNFDGIMPLEIMIDTKRPGGAMQMSTFEKMDELENRIATYAELSQPLSLLNLLKFAKQSFYNGIESYYSLPNNRERGFILQYAETGEENAGLLHSFMDSTRQITRMSIRVKDIGANRMEELYSGFKADVDSVFAPDNYDVVVTGSSVTSFKGTQYLLKNLYQSLALAILLISGFMAITFSSWRMVLMSLIPNIIPLITTAAIMGFADIPIKASTILVFSIAFGISVDDTIHFLSKYRQELNATNWNIRQSVVVALREVGVSMIYTSVVLFFGFGIFALSDFGGTVALGVLVSVTLLVAVTSNIILLPSLLTSLDKFTTTKSFNEPILNIYDEEEDIEVDEAEEIEETEEIEELEEIEEFEMSYQEEEKVAEYV